MALLRLMQRKRHCSLQQGQGLHDPAFLPQGGGKRGQDHYPSEAVTLFIHSLGPYLLRPAICQVLGAKRTAIKKTVKTPSFHLALV